MVSLSHSYSSLKMYANCPYRYYHQRIAKTVTDPGGEATQFGERVHKSIEEYVRDSQPLSREAEGYSNLVDTVRASVAGVTPLVEQELTLNKDLQPTGWWDADAWLRSKLDILVIRDNKAIVIDWKTGKRRPDFDQLELFALQTFAHYPDVDSVTSIFVWLKEDAIDKDVYSREQAPAMWEKLLAKITRIEQSVEHDNWPTKPSGLCRFCPCRNFCESARH